MHEAGRDPEVFGDDAGSFNPHRSIPADAPPYGLGFGSGPHMCAGRSFVLGWHGTDGAVAYLLRWLYRRDAMRDRGATPEYCSDFDLDKWDSYPITMAADAEIGAGAPARS
jgi:hypothetical protein